MKNYLMIAGCAWVGFSICSQAEIVGSFLTQNSVLDYTDTMSVTNLAARTNSGNGGGVVGGTVSAVAGDAYGVGGATPYYGMDTASYTENSQFKDLARYGGHAALISYDFDFSPYLTTHAAGTDAGAFSYSLSSLLSGRRTSGGGNVEFYLSYTDGASMTLDTTDIFGLIPGDSATFNALASNSGKYVLVGAHLANIADATNTWDITSYIAASTDGKFRVLVKDNGEYLGDVVLSNGSGISAVEVIPEPATLGLVGAFGAMVLFIRRRFMI